MSGFDTIITGGKIVDGTGAPAYYADVGIKDGKIAAIGKLRDRDCGELIDAKGKIVAPGHITLHTHYDAALFWDPYVSNSGENGITTILNANCGFGIAPVRPEDQDRIMGMMETTEQIPVAQQRAALPLDWESFPEYLQRIQALPKGVNVMTFLPLNPLLVYVMGVDAAKGRRPTDEEMAEIHRLINEAMDDGAVGISMSVMGALGNTHVDVDGSSMPTDEIEHDVILDIAKALVERGEGVIQLLSQIVVFGDKTISERIAELTKGSGVRVIHNVFVTHDLLPQQVDEDIAWLEKMRANGCDITGNALINRGWVECSIRELDTAGGQLPAVRQLVGCESDEAILELISDPEYVAELEEQYASSDPSNGAMGLEPQEVIDVGDNPELESYLGKTLGGIAEETGSSAVRVFLDLAIRSKLAVQIKSACVSALDPQQGLKLMRHNGIVPGGSDGGAHTKTFSMGNYATDLLIWYVRDTGLMTLEEMHFQLSLKAARCIDLFDRGAILPGFWADLLIYDLDELFVDFERYEIVHDMPEGDWRRKTRAGGYEQILVNGVATHKGDQPTGNTPGLFVRGRDAAA